MAQSSDKSFVYPAPPEFQPGSISLSRSQPIMMSTKLLSAVETVYYPMELGNLSELYYPEGSINLLNGYVNSSQCLPHPRVHSEDLLGELCSTYQIDLPRVDFHIGSTFSRSVFCLFVFSYCLVLQYYLISSHGHSVRLFFFRLCLRRMITKHLNSPVLITGQRWNLLF